MIFLRNQSGFKLVWKIAYSSRSLHRIFGWRLMRVRGHSMLPGLAPGTLRLVKTRPFRHAAPGRGDVVLVRWKDGDARHAVKRLVGLPGELVELRGNKLTIDGVELRESYVRYGQDGARYAWALGPREYVVLGDNRAASSDSRHWGKLDRDRLVGKVWVRNGGQDG